MNSSENINKVYLYFYAFTLLLNAIISGHYTSFSANIAFQTGNEKVPYLPFGTLPGSLFRSILIGFFPYTLKKIIVEILLIVISNLIIFIFLYVCSNDQRCENSGTIPSMVVYGIAIGATSVYINSYFYSSASILKGTGS